MPTGTPKSLSDLEVLTTRVVFPDLADAGGAGGIPHDRLAPFIPPLIDLSRRYVTGANPAVSTMPQAHAYALYYLPINVAKVRRLLREIRPPRGPIRLLDFGCGPGTASLAAAMSLEVPLKIDAVEHSAPMSTLATQLLGAMQAVRPELSFSLREEPGDGYDLIIAANVLNELPPAEVPALLARFVGALAPRGALILLEPALQPTTRALMGIRDLVVERYRDLTVRFPCTRADRCPMMQSGSNDWCHDYLAWEAPPLVRTLDELTGFNKHRIKYSGLVFERDVVLQSGLRVVTIPESDKVGTRATLCGPEVYGPVELMKRHRSETNREYGRVELYDLITIEPPPISGKIQPGALVRRTRSP